MKRSSWLGSVALALMIAEPAIAADLPVRSPVRKAPPVAVYDWTGFYLGAHIGYAWAHQDYTLPVAVALGDTTGEGLIGGGQAGYNWQMGQWVLGVEAQASWSHLRKGVPYVEPSNIVGPNGPVTRGRIGTTVENLGSVAARFGYAWDHVLVYAKAGGAWTSDLYRSFDAGLPGEPLLARATETRFGWMGGLGLEYGMSPNWSAKIEFDYFDLRRERITLTSVPGVTPPTRAFDIDETVALIKAGINYRFGGPIIARY